jgi:hypothetical protein
MKAFLRRSCICNCYGQKRQPDWNSDNAKLSSFDVLGALNGEAGGKLVADAMFRFLISW